MINFFDIFILIVVIGLGVAGFIEGFVRSIVKLAGFLAVIALLAALSENICAVGRRIHFLPSTVALPLAFVILFIIGMIVVALVAKTLHAVIHLTPLGFVDSGLGAAFGVLKALLVGGLVALILTQNPGGSFLQQQVTNSTTGRPLIGLLSGVLPFVRSAVGSFRPSEPEPEPENNNGTTDTNNLI
jgi:membrane protein required for colicin V production